VIHQIKALYNNGNGLGKRAIAKQLNISRNTVRKYLDMDEQTISQNLSETSRVKRMDEYRDHIIHLLHSFPKLSAVKIQRKLREKYPQLDVSDRSIRRYVSDLKQTVCSKQQRYYQPVLDMAPGVQCQVDPGELRGVLINGMETTVYFVVFVLSCSRMMYVAVSPRPIDTACFISMHDAAFRYFGGVTEECVYDQTKLVVISETFREIEVNARFNEYATHAGFRIHACEGYDPESKGKVESGVKYVKQNALYGEQFADWSELEAYMQDWLDNIANQRIHGATGKVPFHHYEQMEKDHMRPYFTPSTVHQAGQMVIRKVDKTGLISWQSNKYSVPMRYQQGAVGVDTIGSELYLYDLETRDEIACHSLRNGTGQVIKNNNHYRDVNQKVTTLEQSICKQIGDPSGIALCALFKKTSPRIYKDQLVAAERLLKPYHPVNETLLATLINRPALTATQLRDYLKAYTDNVDRLQEHAMPPCQRVFQETHASQLRGYAELANQEAVQ